MLKKLLFGLVSTTLILLSGYFISCSKPSVDPPPPENTCATKIIEITGTTIDASSATNGAINVSATGSNGFTYKIGNDAFQTSGNFTNLTPGTYTITAKDDAGCTATKSFTVNAASCPSISISTTTSNSELCATSNIGSITVTASGSTGLTYRLGSTGDYQSSNIFNALNAGNYTVEVKDVNGCTKTSSATVTNLPEGPLFTNVKAVLASNCAFSGCHGGSSPRNGLDFADNCTIVSQKGRINARAVVSGTMPPSGAISAADKQKITDWINAGGKYSN
jgi:hypothetical protein